MLSKISLLRLKCAYMRAYHLSVIILFSICEREYTVHSKVEKNSIEKTIVQYRIKCSIKYSNECILYKEIYTIFH